MTRTAILMAGGQGRRLWPLTRSNRSKQERHFFDSESTFERIYKLLSNRLGAENIFVSAGSAQWEFVNQIVDGRSRIWRQPVDRNNGAGIAYALTVSGFEKLSSSVALIPSDQIIEDPDAYWETLERAFTSAEDSGCITAIGTKPESPVTQYGYLKLGNSDSGTFQIKRFVEKPNALEAERMMDSGDYLWNSGIYVARSEVLMEAYQRHLPLLIDSALSYGEGVPEHIYAELESVSIDYGVMEKLDDLRCVQGDYRWLDVGTYRIFSHYLDMDSDGNAAQGDVVFSESSDCTVIAQQTPAVVYGAQELVVIQLDDILLVCDRNRSEQIKELILDLRSRGREDLL